MLLILVLEAYLILFYSFGHVKNEFFLGLKLCPMTQLFYFLT